MSLDLAALAAAALAEHEHAEQRRQDAERAAAAEEARHAVVRRRRELTGAALQVLADVLPGVDVTELVVEDVIDDTGLVVVTGGTVHLAVTTDAVVHLVVDDDGWTRRGEVTSLIDLAVALRTHQEDRP